jgi:hypothetical protein
VTRAWHILQTVVPCQLPPRAVGTPLRFNSSASVRRDTKPAAISFRMVEAKARARESAARLFVEGTYTPRLWGRSFILPAGWARRLESRLDPIECLAELEKDRIQAKGDIRVILDRLAEKRGATVRDVTVAMLSIDDTLSDLLYDPNRERGSWCPRCTIRRPASCNSCSNHRPRCSKGPGKAASARRSNSFSWCRKKKMLVTTRPIAASTNSKLTGPATRFICAPNK